MLQWLGEIICCEVLLVLLDGLLALGLLVVLARPKLLSGQNAKLIAGMGTLGYL